MYELKSENLGLGYVFSAIIYVICGSERNKHARDIEVMFCNYIIE